MNHKLSIAKRRRFWRSRLWLQVAGLALLAAGFSSSASAKDITCKSNNYKYRHCKADTASGVRLKKVKSKAPCVKDQSWGWDRNGVWVDKGCEAEFELGSDWGGYDPGNAQGRAVQLAQDAIRDRIRQDLGANSAVEFSSAQARDLDNRLQEIEGSGRVRGRRGEWERFDYMAQVDTRRWVVSDAGWRYGPGRDSDGPSRGGQLRVEARIDDEVDFIIQGRRLDVKEITGRRIESLRFDFDGSLPRREVTVQVRKLRGRGEVRVREQPSRRNDYRATISVADRKGGSDRYELEISWY